MNLTNNDSAMDYLLVEDECAQDSTEYFNKQMNEKIGLSISDFKEKGTKKIGRGLLRYYMDDYVLETFVDAPQWHLRKCV